MSADPLSLRNLKFRRAVRHLSEVRRISEAYRSSNPYETLAKADLQPGAIAGVRILREPPTSISVSLGDALQDLKSALDHAVYELARLSQATPRQLEDSEFLITEDASWYATNRKRRLGGVGPGALAFIDGLQPYLGVDDAHPHRGALRSIHQLARIDRHRHIHVARLAMGQPTLLATPLLGHEAPLAVSLSQVHVNVHIPIRIGINEPELMGFVPLASVLDDIEARTGEILVQLADFRPEKGWAS